VKGNARDRWAVTITLWILAAGSFMGSLSTPTVVAAVETAGGTRDAVAVAAEADRLAGQGELWPGFDPRQIPMLIYDGERTWLFHVSQPWTGFTAWPDDPNIFVHPGLHSAVRANTATKVDEMWAAVLMLPTLDMESVTHVAAALIHEAFHVFQLVHHPGWTANEVELFKYPVLDQTMLACRYAEDESLDRAAKAKNAEASLAWARAAVELRARRAERMPEESLRYERDLEVLEGLAHYVQIRAAGSPDAILRRPDHGFAPEQVRARSYWTGVQWAAILDRLDSGWQDRLGRDDQLRLDQLADQLTSEKSIPAMQFEPEEWSRFETLATERVTELQATRDRRRSEFWAAPGLQLEIHASAEHPLRPQGFDPMNITLLADREVLHHRYLKLGNASGSIELLNRAGLTIGAGEHPLFSGVRQLIVTGLDSPGEIEQSGSRVRLEIDGLKLEFDPATLEQDAERLILRIE
jgi:hypothetical protein